MPSKEKAQKPEYVSSIYNLRSSEQLYLANRSPPSVWMFNLKLELIS